MTSRRSSGSIETESAVEPTRSANITVTWRRSASSRGFDSGVPVSWGVAEVVRASSAIARNILRRSPSRTPRSLRSWSVRSDRIGRSIRFSIKASVYSDNPSEVSHSLIAGIAAPPSDTRSRQWIVRMERAITSPVATVVTSRPAVRDSRRKCATIRGRDLQARPRMPRCETRGPRLLQMRLQPVVPIGYRRRPR